MVTVGRASNSGLSVLLVLGLASALCPRPAASAEPVTLAYRYPDGAAAAYKVKGNVSLDMGGIQASAQVEYRCTEKGEADGDSVTVTSVLSDLSESTMVGGQLIPREELGQLNGEAFSYRLSPAGRVSGFVPPAFEGKGRSHREALGPVLVSLRMSLGEYYPELPGHAVSAGDTWEATRETRVEGSPGASGTSTKVSRYTVKKVGNRKGRLLCEVQGTSEGSSTMVLSFGSMVVMATGKGTMEETFEVDVERGLIVRWEAKSRMDVEAVPVDRPGATAVKSKVSGFTKRELEKVE